jgi:ABC-type lipoprotein release transport system permease subunit
VTGFFPRTFADRLAADLLPARAAAWAAGMLGALALLLSTIGLYGMVTWYVEVRRREIGVRVALGASAAAVRWLVVRQALAAVFPGLCLGGAMALATAQLARSLLVGVAPADPLALAFGVSALLGVVLVASNEPSRRAPAVDPVEVLRAE